MNEIDQNFVYLQEMFYLVLSVLQDNLLVAWSNNIVVCQHMRNGFSKMCYQEHQFQLHMIILFEKFQTCFFDDNNSMVLRCNTSETNSNNAPQYYGLLSKARSSFDCLRNQKATLVLVIFVHGFNCV